MIRASFLILVIGLCSVCHAQNVPEAPSDFKVASVEAAFLNKVNLQWKSNALNTIGFEIFWANDLSNPFVFQSDVSFPAESVTIYLTPEQAKGPTYLRIRARTYSTEAGYQFSSFSNTIATSVPLAGVQSFANSGASPAVPEYYLYLPTKYTRASYDKCPVLLFLHGSSAVGGALSKVKSEGPPKLVEEDNPELAILRENFIVISPHMASGGIEQWSDPSHTEAALDILDDVLRNYNADNTRTYIAGLDIGGTGALSICAKYPNQFGACVEMGGSSSVIADPEGYFSLIQTPLWMHHGSADLTVPYSEAEFIAGRLGWMTSVDYLTYDPDISLYASIFTLTTYTDFGHDVWTTAFCQSGIYEWLLNFRRYPQPPSSTSVEGGGYSTAYNPISLSVVGFGQRLKFQWSKDGIDIPGAVSSTYTIPLSKVSDSGEYNVRVSCRDGYYVPFGTTLTIYWATVTILPPMEPISIEYGTPLSIDMFSGCSVYPPVPGVFVIAEGSPLRSSYVGIEFLPDPNYALSAHDYIWVNLTPRPATISVKDTTQVFGSETPVIILLDGILPDDELDIRLGLYLQYDRRDVFDAGTYSVKARSYAPDFFSYAYDFTYVPGTLTILPAPLTVSVVNTTRPAGTMNPAFTAKYVGFPDGLGPKSLTDQPEFSTTATIDSPPGVYPIVVSGASSPNYDITFVAGTLTITNSPPVFASQGISFAPAFPIANQQVHFATLATDSDGQPLSYAWNFGDGSAPEAAQNPTHSYSAPGIYAVALVVNDGFATATQTFSLEIGVGGAQAPIARFTTSDVVGFVGVPLGFDASYSTDLGSTIASYSWNFGDGSSDGAGKEITKSYSTAGAYTVTLTIDDGDGIRASTQRVVEVLPANQIDVFKPFIDFKTSFDRSKTARDTLTLKARVSIGDSQIGDATTVAIEIAGQRFEATLDRKLRATVKATPKQTWKVIFGARKQSAGQVDLQVTTKNAALGQGFNQLGVVPDGDRKTTVSIPVRLEVGTKSFEIPCDTDFKFNKAGTKASGNGKRD